MDYYSPEGIFHPVVMGSTLTCIFITSIKIYTYYELIRLVNIAPRDILLLGYFFLNLAKALGEITLDGLIIFIIT